MSEVGVRWEEEFGVALFPRISISNQRMGPGRGGEGALVQIKGRYIKRAGGGETYEVSDSPTWSDMFSQLGPYF